jgi:hypothetical protein
VLFAALVWTAIAGAASPPLQLRGPELGQVRALVIGIDAYGHVRPLKGAVPDARDLEGALRRMGVGDVTALIDDQADRDSILNAISGLLQRTTANDLVVISIAGHGTQEPERVKGSQPDGMDSVFLLPGFEPTAAGSRQRIIGSEFNHFIKLFEARGARVLFVADSCHGGGLTRDADPRAAEMSFRQVPTYRIPNDALTPISTTSEAFLTELDFQKTAFLAAVDRKTKAPEIRIPGVQGFRGALSYAVARAFEGAADSDHDGHVTLKELFTYVRQVVYQLSDQRQNVVALNSPHRNLDRDVAFEVTRGVTVIDTALEVAKPQIVPQMPISLVNLAPVRIASLDGQASQFDNLQRRDAPFEVVAPSQAPDLVWDPATGDVLAGGDVVAYRLSKSDLPSVIDRTAAVRALKQLATRAPQLIKVTPDDKLHRNESRVAVEVAGTAQRALLMFNIAGDGTIQLLYPVRGDPIILSNATHQLPVRVRGPFGADQVVAITSQTPMVELQQALEKLNQRRTAVQALKMVEQFRPSDSLVGATGIFTAP